MASSEDKKIEISESFRRVVEEWQKPLRDTSRRNKRLFFRKDFSKDKSVVQVIQQDPDELLESLKNNLSGLSFNHIEHRSGMRSEDRQSNRFRVDQASTKVSVDDAQPNHETTEPSEYEIQGDIQTNHETGDLEKRLYRIRSRARTVEQEQGISTLRLVLGMIEWVDDDGDTAFAPLGLLEVRLERDSTASPFTLVAADDFVIPELNTLWAEYRNIQLPAIEENQLFSEYIEIVQDLLAEGSDYQITPEIYLANFSFSKQEIWQDLEDIKQNGTDHEIVLGLGGERTGSSDSTIWRESDSNKLPDDSELAGGGMDDYLALERQYTVLPADFSQMRAIDLARKGHDLVMHGPPGTGKSQTIANIVASSIADGKSVLFVSEKSTALEVVKNRLDEIDLGIFALDLHNPKAQKRSIYDQFKQSLETPLTFRKSTLDIEDLEERRRQLNAFVRILHDPIQPLGQTIYSMQGKFALLQTKNQETVQLKSPDMAQFDMAQYRLIEDIAHRLSSREREFSTHENNHWHILKHEQSSLNLTSDIQDDMDQIIAASLGLEHIGGDVADDMGISVGLNLKNAHDIEVILGFLSNAPGIPTEWIQGETNSRLRKIGEEQQTLGTAWKESLAIRNGTFETPTSIINYNEIAEATLPTDSEAEAVGSGIIGTNWEHDLLQHAQQFDQDLRTIHSAIDEIAEIIQGTPRVFEGPHPQTLPEIKALIDIIPRANALGQVPESWVGENIRSEFPSVISWAKDKSKSIELWNRSISMDFDLDVVKRITPGMWERYQTKYNNVFRRIFSGSYKEDRQLLRDFRTSDEKFSFPLQLQVVNTATWLQKDMEEWGARREEMSHLLGHRWNDLLTDWESVQGAFLEVLSILQQWPDQQRVVKALLTQPSQERDGELDSQVDLPRLRNLVSNLEIVTKRISSTDMRVRMETGELGLFETDSYPSLGSLAKQAQGFTARVAAFSESNISLKSSVSRISQVGAGALAGIRVQEIEAAHEDVAVTHKEEFGDYYNGLETDWNAIFGALDWAQTFVFGIDGVDMPSELVSHIENPRIPSHYTTMQANLNDALIRFENALETISGRYNLDAAPWISWRETTMSTVQIQAQTLSDDAPFATDWIQYRTAAAELDEIFGPDSIGHIRQITQNSEEIPDIVEKFIVSQWLLWIFQEKPELEKFNPLDHDIRIRDFKNLDQDFVKSRREKVREKGFEKYPRGRAAPTDRKTNRESNLGVLRHEVQKQRRHIPIRRLLPLIPRVVKELKPCIFMSPLTVSQYLPLSLYSTDEMKFDVVIFDEASQVFPQDAVPSILRGKQVIFAGDQSQLPPTMAWQQVQDDDDDGDDESINPNLLEGMDSVLDGAVAQTGDLFVESYLGVHYRSRDESLIRFSNPQFYNNKLLTFPAAETMEWNGVHSHYLDDAVYEPGSGKRINRKEADFVVDLIIEHVRTKPEHSLGVVALGQPQTELIRDLLVDRLLKEADIEVWFKEDKDEEFFIKNLESVQGDERDRIILDIGYGPTEGSKKVPNRFGPINNRKGENRLNVAITRSKYRIDVVHSLQHTDITSEQPGPRVLRNYLEYIKDPERYFEAQTDIDPSAEADSPFEEAVELALTQRGHRVVRQVGVSGYKIDLAIQSDTGEGFDLGIECDGATYHSAPAARDRDWQRQGVLEGLGWTIHRIWSTSWLRNPEREIQRIEDALRDARNNATGVSTNPVRNPKSSIGSDADNNRVIPENNDIQPPTFAEEHVELTTSTFKLEEYVFSDNDLLPTSAGDLGTETRANLKRHIEEIVRVEEPIHRDILFMRLREVYQTRTIGSRVRERINDLLKKLENISADGDFFWYKEPSERPPRTLGERKIDQVHVRELGQIVVRIAHELYGIGSSGLIEETARILGGARRTSQFQSTVNEAIEQMKRGGDLIEIDGALYAQNISDTSSREYSSFDPEDGVSNSNSPKKPEVDASNQSNSEPINDWDAHFRLLQQYVAREGHCSVPNFHVESGKRLGIWVNYQRHLFRQGMFDLGTLGPKQKALLESVPGWTW